MCRWRRGWGGDYEVCSLPEETQLEITSLLTPIYSGPAKMVLTQLSGAITNVYIAGNDHPPVLLTPGIAMDFNTNDVKYIEATHNKEYGAPPLIALYNLEIYRNAIDQEENEGMPVTLLNYKFYIQS